MCHEPPVARRRLRRPGLRPQRQQRADALGERRDGGRLGGGSGRTRRGGDLDGSRRPGAQGDQPGSGWGARASRHERRPRVDEHDLAEPVGRAHKSLPEGRKRVRGGAGARPSRRRRGGPSVDHDRRRPRVQATRDAGDEGDRRQGQRLRGASRRRQRGQDNGQLPDPGRDRGDGRGRRLGRPRRGRPRAVLRRAARVLAVRRCGVSRLRPDDRRAHLHPGPVPRRSRDQRCDPGRGTGRSVGAELPIASLAREHLERAEHAGWGAEDWAVIGRVLAGERTEQ